MKMYEDLACMYVSMYVCGYVCTYVCMRYILHEDRCNMLCTVFLLHIEGGERGRRPPLPEIVRSSYRRLQ